MSLRRQEVFEIQETLKHLIGARKLTLSEMSVALEISIATAKRLLNGDDLSIERVLQLCDWLEIRFHELIEMATRRRTEYHFSSPDQEKFLADHHSHFAFLKAIQKGDSLDALKIRHKISDADCSAYLSDLEQHGFLEKTAETHFKLKVKDGMDWRPDGPLWKKFFGRWVREFAEHAANKTGENSGECIVEISQRKLSKKSFDEMKREFDELSRKYASISRLERELQPSDSLDYCSCLVFADMWSAPIWDVRPYGK